jgi:hypothetical protein
MLEYLYEASCRLTTAGRIQVRLVVLRKHIEHVDLVSGQPRKMDLLLLTFAAGWTAGEKGVVRSLPEGAPAENPARVSRRA